MGHLLWEHVRSKCDWESGWVVKKRYDEPLRCWNIYMNPRCIGEIKVAARGKNIRGLLHRFIVGEMLRDIDDWRI